MIGLLADHDVERQARLIWAQFSPRDWEGMHVSSLAMVTDVGLLASASDREIWLACQRTERVLLTANRNMEGVDSLEAVIRELGDASSLPVLTIADPDRVLFDADYREMCAYRIADIALELEKNLGTARLFIP
jgi:hypothetical protein